MLRAPLLHHPILGSSSLSVLARAASQILRIYWDLSRIGMLEPCWIQLQRILCCMQLAILTCSEGFLHPSEVKDLLSIGIDLVRKHEPVSEFALQMASWLEAAQDKLLFGLVLPQISSPNHATPPITDPLVTNAVPSTGFEFDWPSFLAGIIEGVSEPTEPVV
jgi:hypothetical protein